MTVEAHIDIRVEGKGRSVHQPRKRLKFENILTVVPLLFLACVRERVQTHVQRLHKGRNTICSEAEKEIVTDFEICCATT